MCICSLAVFPNIMSFIWALSELYLNFSNLFRVMSCFAFLVCLGSLPNAKLCSIVQPRLWGMLKATVNDGSEQFRFQEEVLEAWPKSTKSRVSLEREIQWCLIYSWQMAKYFLCHIEMSQNRFRYMMDYNMRHQNIWCPTWYYDTWDSMEADPKQRH